jgi:hypothetical protein
MQWDWEGAGMMCVCKMRDPLTGVFFFFSFLLCLLGMVAGERGVVISGE